MNAPDTRLDELDKTEGFDLARKVKPGITWEEYEQMWELNMQLKAERERAKELQ